MKCSLRCLTLNVEIESNADCLREKLKKLGADKFNHHAPNIERWMFDLKGPVPNFCRMTVGEYEVSHFRDNRLAKRKFFQIKSPTVRNVEEAVRNEAGFYRMYVYYITPTVAV